MLAGFIAIFLVVYTMGFAQYTELRFLNIFVHISCMYVAIRTFYKKDIEDIDNYLLGVAQGIEASVIGVVGYAIFVAIFLQFDPRLMDLIKQNSNMAIYLNPYTEASMPCATPNK